MQPKALTANSDDEHVRLTERERTRALVSGDMEVARQLHADDYELVTPLGVVLSKERYLGAVAGGDLHYLVWDVESPMEVRMYSEVALIRYQADIKILCKDRDTRARGIGTPMLMKSVLAVGRSSGRRLQRSRSPMRECLRTKIQASKCFSSIAPGICVPRRSQNRS